MCQPYLPALRVAGGGKAVRESDFRGVAVRPGKRCERNVVRAGASEFRRELFLRGLDRPRPLRRSRVGARIRVRVSPLDDVVVLRSEEREAVEVFFADESLDI